MRRYRAPEDVVMLTALLRAASEEEHGEPTHAERYAPGPSGFGSMARCPGCGAWQFKLTFCGPCERMVYLSRRSGLPTGSA